MIICSDLHYFLEAKCQSINRFYLAHVWQIYALVLFLLILAAFLGMKNLDKLRFAAVDKTLKDKKIGVGRTGEAYELPRWRLKRNLFFGRIQALILRLPAGKSDEEIIAASTALAACLGREVRFTEPKIEGLKVIFHVRNFK